MRRFVVLPVLALAFAIACENRPTSPDRIQPDAAGPSFQEGPSDAQCIGTLPPGMYQNVIVPKGATCFLFNSTLTGNVKALEGSNVTTFNNTIAGNVQADKTVFARFFNDRVGGDIDIVDGQGITPFFPYAVCGVNLSQGNIHIIKNTGGIAVGGACEGNTLVKGSIKVEDNVIPVGGELAIGLATFAFFGNTVAQNIQVFKNMGPGPKRVNGNTAGESIQCFDNAPPFVGGPNIAPKREGQCF